VSAPLTPEELELVRKLAAKGVQTPPATLAVALITREHSRPEQELAHIVRQYQGLEDPKVAAEAIADLKQRGWLNEYQTYGVTLLRQDPDLLRKVADLIDERGTIGKLEGLRAAVNPYVKILGSMNDAKVYTSYLELLQGAHTQIRLPMLATTPELGSVPILKERAKAGVRVKILLGSPRVVCQLRGGNMLETANRAIAGWLAHAKDVPNIEVRITDNVDDMLVATCMSVDDNLLRYDVYDARRQRSLQGIMIEVRSPQQTDLNIVAWFRRSFDDAWARAYRPTTAGRIVHFIESNWYWLLFGGFTLASALTARNTLWFAINTSVAASFFFSAIVLSRESIAAFFRRGARR
jgi:hypothetical protein